MPNARPTVLITGSSSGIGRSTVEAFLERGWNVAATMRTPSTDDWRNEPDCLVTALDVVDPDSIHAAFRQTVEHFGRLDSIVNNAGYGLMGPLESLSGVQISRQIETNVVGTMRVTAAALPYLRQSDRGTVINMSSVSGVITIPHFSLYHASKWAVEGFSESLWHELRPLNIRVRIIQPGPIESSFYGRSLDQGEDHPAYADQQQRLEERLRLVTRMSGTAHSVAAVIVRAAESRSWRLRYGVNTFGLPLLRKFLPERLLREITHQVMLGRGMMGSLQRTTKRRAPAPEYTFYK
jgi:NAD(P)-dependent dehydrogenase (short-subunit alcohol dehydrogenase family)